MAQTSKGVAMSEKREPTMEEAAAVYHAIDGVLQAIPAVCDERTNIMLDGFVCLLYARLTHTVLDAELLDMDRIRDAVEQGLNMHLLKQNGNETMN